MFYYYFYSTVKATTYPFLLTPPFAHAHRTLVRQLDCSGRLNNVQAIVHTTSVEVNPLLTHVNLNRAANNLHVFENRQNNMYDNRFATPNDRFIFYKSLYALQSYFIEIFMFIYFWTTIRFYTRSLTSYHIVILHCISVD